MKKNIIKAVMVAMPLNKMDNFMKKIFFALLSMCILSEASAFTIDSCTADIKYNLNSGFRKS